MPPAWHYRSEAFAEDLLPEGAGREAIGTSTAGAAAGAASESLPTAARRALATMLRWHPASVRSAGRPEPRPDLALR